jgi:hypothetical protein
MLDSPSYDGYESPASDDNEGLFYDYDERVNILEVEALDDLKNNKTSVIKLWDQGTLF